MTSKTGNHLLLQSLRVLLALALIPVAEAFPNCWAAPLAVWAILNFIGLLLLIPVIVVIGLGAGAAQADWMSDGFVFVVCIAFPTLAACSFSEFSRRRHIRRSSSSI